MSQLFSRAFGPYAPLAPTVADRGAPIAPSPRWRCLHQLGVWQIEQFERAAASRAFLAVRAGTVGAMGSSGRRVGRTAAGLRASVTICGELVTRVSDDPAGDARSGPRTFGQSDRRTVEALQSRGDAVGMPFPMHLGRFDSAFGRIVSADGQGETIRRTSGSPIRTGASALAVGSMSLEATVTAPLELQQQELFSESSPRRHPRNLAGLINRLSNRLGRRRVVRVRLVPDAQPEMAYRYVPVLDAHGRRTSSRTKRVDSSRRPLRLLARPIRLTAGAQSQVDVLGHHYQIAQTWGPERIETGWWRGQAIGRDYYRIETTTGRRLWVFRRLRDGQWFLAWHFQLRNEASEHEEEVNHKGTKTLRNFRKSSCLCVLVVSSPAWPSVLYSCCFLIPIGYRLHSFVK